MAEKNMEFGYKNNADGFKLLKVVSKFLTAPFQTASKYTSQELFEGLLREEEHAFAALLGKVLPVTKKFAQNIGLSAEDAEDLTHEAVINMIEKLRNGAYKYQGNDPASYVIKGTFQRMIGRKRTERRREEKHQDAGFLAFWEGNVPPITLDEQESILERKQLLDQALNQVGEKCRLLITLHYWDKIPDKEVVDQGLSPYSTIDALKNKRCICMKRLKELMNPGKAPLSQD